MAFKRAANQKLVEVALAALGWLLAPSCSLDNRDPRLAFSDAGVSRGGTVDGEDVELPDTQAKEVCDAGHCLTVESSAVSPQCPGCVVDGECRGTGELNPNNPCEICAPDRNPAGWAPYDGVACDDGLFCTADDVCREGQCTGSERHCDDDVACNGVSVCVEAEHACSAAENQCADPGFCDVASGECVSTCDGCVIAGVCLAAEATASGNPCLVCDPGRSRTSYSAAVDRPCGTAATECSAQDTCNAQGQCQPNHFELGTPCGSPVSTQCDAADTCDGNGICLARVAAANSPCDDGQFCSVGDRCQGGQCLAGGARDCGQSATCDEAANACRVPNGGACQTDAECLNGLCRDQFIDGDADGYPNLTAPIIRLCGNTPQPGRIFGRADGEIDCCDGDDRVFPGATPPSTGFQGVLGYDQRNGCMNFNYDCRNGESSSGRQSHQYPGGGACINEPIAGLSMAQAAQACEDVAGWDGVVPPACGQSGTMVACAAAGGGTCTNFGFIPETRFCF